MIKHLFKLDLRSLALARIFLGILAFYDLSRRIPDLGDFFTDSGIMPRWILLEQFQINWKMSLLYLNGSYSWALMILLIGLVATVTFILGWRTRISNAILWITIVSFQQRFPEAATSGGDMLLRIFLFYSLFLPMNARYSFDAAVSEVRKSEDEHFSVFTTLWIVQIMLLYIMTFLYKWAPVYHTTFDAVWYMLQLDLFTTDFGKWLGQQYMATKVLSFSAYALEIIGPLMLFIPFKRDLFRGAAVVSFWLFHLGIGATMHLGNFVPICLIIWVGLIPTMWWDWLAARFKIITEEMAILYFNGESEFARKLAFISRDILFLNAKVVPAPYALLEEGRSFAFETSQKQVFMGQGMFAQMLLTSRLKVFRVVGRLLTSEMGVYLSEVKEVGEVSLFSDKDVNPAVKRNSHKVFNSIKVLFETIGFGQVRMKLNKFERFLGGFLVTVIVAWNIEGYVEDRKWYIGAPFDEIMFALQLNQGWAMFAPHPQRSDGWWVMEGKLKNGKAWDALNNKDVSFDRPESFFATFSSDDWMKFMDNLQASRDENYLLLLGRHLCRKWNSQHYGGEALETFKLHFMQEWTNGPQEEPSKVNKLTLWNHNCF